MQLVRGAELFLGAGSDRQHGGEKEAQPLKVSPHSFPSTFGGPTRGIEKQCSVPMEPCSDCSHRARRSKRGTRGAAILADGFPRSAGASDDLRKSRRHLFGPRF